MEAVVVVLPSALQPPPAGHGRPREIPQGASVAQHCPSSDSRYR